MRNNKTVAVYPPNLVELEDRPCVFLAGPIKGAENWQEEAIGDLSKQFDGIVIASPRDPGPKWHGDYNAQVDWETRYLHAAAHHGVILFWLGKEETHTCERAYAQTTRFELGEWFGKSRAFNAQYFVLGIEEGFTNEPYIRRRVGQVFPDLEIHSSLDDTCQAAINAVLRL
jgi:hypothetical protein